VGEKANQTYKFRHSGQSETRTRNPVMHVIANHVFGVMKRSQAKAVNRDEGDKRDNGSPQDGLILS